MFGFEEVEPEFRQYPEIPAHLPTRATSRSAAHDIFIKAEVIVPAHGVKLIVTDLKMYMAEPRQIGLIFVNPALTFSTKLTMATIYVLDKALIDLNISGGNIAVAVYNPTNEPIVLPADSSPLQAVFGKFDYSPEAPVLDPDPEPEYLINEEGSTNE